MAVTKRYAAPRFWPIKVKAKKYVISPVPGPHSKKECVPLGIILRDMLKHARTLKEVRQMLNSGIVKINGTVRKNHGFPVGVMDVIDIGGDFYRAMPSKNGIQLFRTDENDAGIRLAKIKNKVYIRKKRLQLNLHDGSNILFDKDAKTNDVLVIDTNHKIIKDTIKFEKGNFAIVTAGRSAGVKGKIGAVDKNLHTVVIESDKGKFLVPLKYVFVVGRGQPVISVGE